MHLFLWLALAATVATAASTLAGDVVISEIYYHSPSGIRGEQFLELHNTGTKTVNLAGWKISRGVTYDFPNVFVAPGQFLLVAANKSIFSKLHPTVGNVVGDWIGSLGQHGETLTLVDSKGAVSDSLEFHTQGDWAERRRGPLDHEFQGWEWFALHDGGGYTLERISPRRDGNSGQNWRTSSTAGGTPGSVNGVSATEVAPYISNVQHQPPVPSSSNPVTITARVADEIAGSVVSVAYRLDGAPTFTTLPMDIDPATGDGSLSGGIYRAVLPPQTNGAIVEFYIRAVDIGGRARSWPAPTQPANAQLANALYQVDDSTVGILPRFRLIMMAAERADLAQIDGQIWSASSNAKMNTTFVSYEDNSYHIRYTTGLRLRGSTSRLFAPKSRRVLFPDDHSWAGVIEINLNGVRPHSQVAGSALARLAGLAAARSRLVEVRENNVAPTGNESPVAGLLAHNEVLDSDYTRAEFPDNPGGNLYDCGGMGLEWLGTNVNEFLTIGWVTKASNTTENDWSDLFELLRVLNFTPATNYTSEVGKITDIPGWMRYFAVNTLLGDTETSLGSGEAGEFYVYHGPNNPRFQLIPYDLDSVLGTDIDGTGSSLYRAAYNRLNKQGTPGKLLRSPGIGEQYHLELHRLMSSVFRPDRVAAVLDQLLRPHVPAEVVNRMKVSAQKRFDFVTAQLALLQKVSVTTPSLTGGSTGSTTADTVTVEGLANPQFARAIRVNGIPADWNGFEGKWEATVPLLPGINTLAIEALDVGGQVVSRGSARMARASTAIRPVEGTLGGSTHWQPSDGAIQVTGPTVIPVGGVLTIAPGTSVSFNNKAGLEVKGQLIAEGTASNRIRFDRLGTGNWAGIKLNHTTTETRIRYADFGENRTGVIGITNSFLLLEDVNFEKITEIGTQIIWITDSSIVVRHCTFPAVAYIEPVRGENVTWPPGGQVLFEGNTFGSTVGYADIIDFSGGIRPGPIPRFIDNVFLGGSDDILDLDGTDAHIEGNLFMNCNKANSDGSEAGAISGGNHSYGGVTRNGHWVAVRNLFVDNDYDFIAKEGSFVTAINNTFVHGRHGSLAVSEPLRPGEAPPAGAILQNNIWSQYNAVIAHLDPRLLENGTIQLKVENSLFDQTVVWPGVGDFSADPAFISPPEDYHLQTGSSAAGLAPGGIDLGAFVPAGAIVTGIPEAPTTRHSILGRVYGPGLSRYRFRIDGGVLSADRLMDEPLLLTGLSTGSHSLQVFGQNSAGDWQAEPGTVSTWQIAADFGDVRINEILASNTNDAPFGVTRPDLIELYNPGNLPFALEGTSLTDDPAKPRKFVFPAGTVLPAGGYLTVFCDKLATPLGFHTGFGLDVDGESVLLYDSTPRGGAVLDRIVFGPQIPGVSLVRQDNGSWGLGQPTFGAANNRMALGNPRRIVINELYTKKDGAPVGEFVELFNQNDLPVLLNNFSLSAAPLVLRQFPLPPLTAISGRSVQAMLKQADGSRLQFESEFGAVYFSDGSGSVIDAVAWNSQTTDHSLARVPDGTGPFVNSELAPTPGALNTSTTPAPAPSPILQATLAQLTRLLVVEASPAVVGHIYLLESRGNLEPTGWTIAAQVTATTTTVQFPPQSADVIQFYRVRIIP
ncbi:MAG: hypothetical protein EXS36_00325 [Pedosphaera sp.]|nr:hypothetical protein [Pedosphaera sp.]